MKENQMFFLSVDDQPKIKFTGVVLARAASSYYDSGETGICYEITIYKTKKNIYVAHIIRRTQWQNDNDKYYYLKDRSLNELINKLPICTVKTDIIHILNNLELLEPIDLDKE